MKRAAIASLLLAALALPAAAQLQDNRLTLRATFADPRLDPAAIRYSGSYTYCETDECFAFAFCTAEVNVQTATIGGRSVPFQGVVRLSFERFVSGVIFNGAGSPLPVDQFCQRAAVNSCFIATVAELPEPDAIGQTLIVTSARPCY